MSRAMPTCCPEPGPAPTTGCPSATPPAGRRSVAIQDRNRQQVEKPSDREISTRKPRNAATPASADSPANSAIDSGPLRFSATRAQHHAPRGAPAARSMLQLPPGAHQRHRGTGSVCRSMLSGPFGWLGDVDAFPRAYPRPARSAPAAARGARCRRAIADGHALAGCALMSATISAKS